MIKYKSQYEEYYKNLKGKINSHGYEGGCDRGYTYKASQDLFHKESNLGLNFIRKIIIQTVIVSFMLCGILILKHIDTKESNLIYTNIDKLINQEIEYEKIVDTCEAVINEGLEVFSQSIN